MQKVHNKSYWTKNTAIYVCGRGRRWERVGSEGVAVEKVAKGANILHKFAYNCLNLAWCCAREYISIWREGERLRGEGSAGHMQNMPHIVRGTHNTCSSCHNWEPAANSRFLDNMVLYVPPACLCVCVCMRVCWRFLRRECFPPLPAVLNTHAASPRPLLVSPQKPLMRNSRSECCCKALSLQAAFPCPSPFPILATRS